MNDKIVIVTHQCLKHELLRHFAQLEKYNMCPQWYRKKGAYIVVRPALADDPIEIISTLKQLHENGWETT